MDKIWWEQITKASLFSKKVIHALADGYSVVLKLPHHVPWYDTLVGIINDGVIDHGMPRSIYQVEGIQDPGKYLLENFCKKEVRLTYRIGKSYACFLAEQEAITLNSSIIWVKNLNSEYLKNWVSFVQEYNRKIPDSRQSALFLLEIRGDEGAESDSKHMKCISFSSEISSYDKYTFCTLVSATAPVEYSIKPYLAELVSTVCSDDIELCAQCITDGVAFAKDPITYLQTVADTACRSDGTPFELNLTSEEQQYRVWESQLRMIFPMIERFRMQFINEHRSDIQRELPLETNFGERIEDPEDVEIGMLFYLTSTGAIQMRDNSEWPKLRTFKEARNELAHLNQLPFAMIYEILTGKRKL